MREPRARRRRGESPTRSSRRSRERLRFLIDVGLDYLTLDRSAETLSGGEAQRIRLATQIGSGLTGVMYVLDEPSIGLHQRDNARLIGTLKQLRDLGNTVIVVEHDEDTIRAADYVVDMGPGAGVHGGAIVAQGTPAEIDGRPGLAHRPVPLGARAASRCPTRRSAPDRQRQITHRRRPRHNLKNVDRATSRSGSSPASPASPGSGKSTLVNDTLFAAPPRSSTARTTIRRRHERHRGPRAIDKVIDIDQSPIGRTPRSNPATTRALRAAPRALRRVPEARARGYKPGASAST